MFLLFLLLFCFTVFTFVVTNKGAGAVVSGRGYKEYKLGDYSNWKKIQSCIRDAKICDNFGQDNAGIVADEFNNKHLSPLQAVCFWDISKIVLSLFQFKVIQSGCCKPLTICVYTYVNAINWTVKMTNATDPDCGSSSNGQDQLCYTCISCKAGVLANLKSDWQKIAVLNIIMLICLIVVYSVGCCALRNNRQDNGAFGYKGGIQGLVKLLECLLV